MTEPIDYAIFDLWDSLNFLGRQQHQVSLFFDLCNLFLEINFEIFPLKMTQIGKKAGQRLSD